MKKLLTLFLVPLLSGCVTYYTPEIAIDDGIYYAGADPAYSNNAYVSGYYGYAGAAYYPWRSMDYFYLGYRPYYYAYSPWYSSYYSYFSPWNYPYNHHAYHRSWRKHGGYCRPYNACGQDSRRYADNSGDYPTDYRNRGRDDEDGNEDPGNRRKGNRPGGDTIPPPRRYVSTAPSGYSGSRGMVIRSGESTKQGKVRTGPVRMDPVTVTSPSPATTRLIQQGYRSRGEAGEIRYRSGAKQGTARTEPVRAVSLSSNSDSGKSSRPPSRSGGNGPVPHRGNSGSVSHGSRSHTTSSGAGGRSSRGNSRHSKRHN